MFASTMFITSEGEVTAMLPISQRRKLSHRETRGCSVQMGEVLEKPTALRGPCYGSLHNSCHCPMSYILYFFT